MICDNLDVGRMKPKSFEQIRSLPTFRLVLAMILALLGTACTKNKSENETPSSTTVVTHSAERGRTIYQTQCIACHNSDPRKPGSLGPDVFGSSRELLEARILHGSYPQGYKPKRESHSMAPLPHLKYEIDSIHDYLNQIE